METLHYDIVTVESGCEKPDVYRLVMWQDLPDTRNIVDCLEHPNEQYLKRLFHRKRRKLKDNYEFIKDCY